MLFLWVCGVLLEDVWGRGAFLGFYILAGLVSLGPNVWLRDEYVNSIGASGAISGVMGAFAVRFWNVRLRILVMVGILTRSLWVSSWIILLFWLANDIAGISAQLNGDTDTGHMTHVAGFAFGAVFALVMRRTHAEERFLAPVVDGKSMCPVLQKPHVERAFEDLDLSRPGSARKRLTRSLEKDRADVDAAVALWDAALVAEEDATARGAMADAIREELRSGDMENAIGRWRELSATFPDASLDFTSLLRLGEALVARGYLQEGGEAMAKALSAASSATPPALLLRLAREAVEVEPQVCAQAAGLVLDREMASPADKAEARAMLERAEESSIRVSG